MDKPLLLIAESNGFSQQAIERLSNEFEVKTGDLSRHELIKELHSVSVLWVRLRTMIDHEVMKAGPQLRAIVTNTTGLTHIDLDAAKEFGIAVISLKGEYEFLRDIRATAEHTLGLTLALLRRIPSAHMSVSNGNWDRYQFKGTELHCKTVGVIGYGRLGGIVSEYFKAMGAIVLVCDRQKIETINGIEDVGLFTLLQRSDVVSLHVNFEPANRHMIGEKEFAAMKTHASLINTSRGELIDEAALLNALTSRSIGGAAIDVLHNEHNLDLLSHPLRKYAVSNENLILTPHIGGYTTESTTRTELFLAMKLERIFTTKHISGF